MDKKILVKYIEQKTNNDESRLVLDWIAKNSDNEEYFLELRELYIMTTLPSSPPSVRQLNNLIKIKRNTKIRQNFYLLMKFAAIFLIFLSIGMNISTISGKSTVETAPISIMSKELSYLTEVQLDSILAGFTNTIYTPKGAKSKINLPDGSEVWLNSDSKITYPIKFSEGSRVISLNGEAYFKVQSDTAAPMIVKAKDILVRVTGTEFNVRAYANEESVSTTLISGGVDVYSKRVIDGTYVVNKLRSMESFRYIPNKIDNISSLDTDKKVAWKDGVLYFKSTPMQQVIKDLERWHGVEILVQDPRVADYKFTAVIHNQSMVQILEMLRFCSLIDYKMDGEKVYLFIRK